MADTVAVIPVFRHVVSPLIDLGIPWTYVPGNHDDNTKSYSRKDLLNVLSLPMCVSKGMNSFSHTLKIGPMQLYLIDSHSYAKPNSENLSKEYIKNDQIEWYNKTPSETEVGLAFFHIPLAEYRQAKGLVGNRGEGPLTPYCNSGFFRALRKKKDVHAVFGNDHMWSDFVSELNNAWLCNGKVSGFTYSTVYGKCSSPTNGQRGGRVIRYDSTTKGLSTWVENKKGLQKESIISRTASAQNFTDVLDE